MNKEITTIEAALAAKGIDPNNFPKATDFPENMQELVLRSVNEMKLKIVVEAINDGWKPDYTDSDQRKWYPWFWVKENKSKPAGLGLSLALSDYARTDTRVGSRLCFESSDAVRHAVEHFLELYEAVLLG